MKNVNNENPNEHWEFINVNEKTVLDLGCGRWESVEYRDPNWPTTPEYWIQKGAKYVVGIDADQNEIDWFLKMYKDEVSYEFNCMMINSPNDFNHLINQYKPNVIKCDIEEGEIHLINLDDETFKLVDEYYIETHGDELYSKCVSKLSECGYEIYEEIDLTHTRGYCKVLFAKKK